MEFNFEEIVKHFELSGAGITKAHYNRVWVNSRTFYSYIYRDTITIK